MLPYLVAVLQHFLFGDFVEAFLPILWPVSQVRFGLGWGLLSTEGLMLELLGLALLPVVAYYARDLGRLVSKDRGNLLFILPVLIILSSNTYLGLGFGPSPPFYFSIIQAGFMVSLLAPLVRGVSGLKTTSSSLDRVSRTEIS